MVFKRRTPLSWLEWIREGVIPRAGWKRVLNYMAHRVQRIPDSPHKVSLGLACGTFVSFSPLFGFHFVYAAALALLFRGNVIASLSGTFFGNPITFPFIAGSSLWLGRTILGVPGSTDFHVVSSGFSSAFTGIWTTFKSLFGYGRPAWNELGSFFDQLFLPYLVGGIMPGLVCAVGVYYVSRPLVRAYQARRRERLLSRIAARAAKKKKLTAGADAATLGD